MPDISITNFLLSPFGIAPLAGAVAWFRWRVARQRTWRGYVLLGGLIATTVNVLMFYGWFVYRLVVGAAPDVWRLKDQLGDIGLVAATAAFVAALVGKGSGRWSLALSGVAGFLFWPSYGFL